MKDKNCNGLEDVLDHFNFKEDENTAVRFIAPNMQGIQKKCVGLCSCLRRSSSFNCLVIYIFVQERLQLGLRVCFSHYVCLFSICFEWACRDF